MKISSEALTAMKRVSLPEVMAGYGLEVKTDGREKFLTRCPFHEDKTPSLSVSRKDGRWLWNCFGCRKSGNVIDFVIHREGIPFGEAYRKLLPKVSANPNLIEQPLPP